MWGSVQITRVVFLLAFVLILGATEDVRIFFERHQARITRIRDELESRLHGEQPRSCDCSYYAYGSAPPTNITQCIQSGHDEKLDCSFNSCGHMKISRAETYFQIPTQQTISDMPTALKRDLCLTQGMASTFRKFRKDYRDFAPPTFFGSTDTAPGQASLGEFQKEADEKNQRTQPWWRLASYHQRNVVILIDVTSSMNEMVFQSNERRWKMALLMTNRMLDMLNERDTFQILAFDSKVQNLASDSETGRDDGMVQAREKNVQKIRRVLEKLQPGKETRADIGEALDSGFYVLQDNILRGSQKCENHILLFTGSRDCGQTTAHDCRSKRYAGFPNFEFMSNLTAIMLDFVQNELLDKLSREMNPPVLFTYALHPNANGLLSQLACKLNGSHVDIGKALRQKIVDPLHLMRGYFLRAAIPVSLAFTDSRQMAVDYSYTDDQSSDFKTTFAIPVFYQPHQECPSLHFGVIGAEMPAQAYKDAVIDYESSGFRQDIFNWNEDIDTCLTVIHDRCHMQVLRETQCVSPIEAADKPDEAKCYQYKKNHYYVNRTAGRSPGYYGFGFRDTREMCKELDGQMIAPKDVEERRVLAAIIPPDGAWIDAEQKGVEWYWPDGDRVEGESRVRQTCPSAFGTRFFMDPRSYDDNFHCIQRRMKFALFCKFIGEQPPDVCADLKIERIEATVPLPGTVEACGMEDCILNSDAYGDLLAEDLVCNIREEEQSFSEIACCSAGEIGDKCSVVQELGNAEAVNQAIGRSNSNDSSNAQVIVLIVTIVLFVTAVVVTTVSCMKRDILRSFRWKSANLTDSDASPVNDFQMCIQERGIGDALPSPVRQQEAAPEFGKKPELVVNIVVNMLNNGWERRGIYGRVRQGDFKDNRGHWHSVVMKFVDTLPPRVAWEALRSEFEILCSIPLHPNIVRPFGVCWGNHTDQIERYMVEEFMHTNLGAMIDVSGPSPFPGKMMLYRDWIRIYIDIAAALRHLHQHKIIHFNLKPSNVLLTEDMTAKVTDYGNSKLKLEAHLREIPTPGSLAFLAPECSVSYYSQRNRQDIVKARIDVYSFGMIVWESLGGRTSRQSNINIPMNPSPPVLSNHENASNTISEEGSASVDGEVRNVREFHLPDSIPQPLRELIGACVQFDADLRPSFEEIGDKLHNMLREVWIHQHV